MVVFPRRESYGGDHCRANGTPNGREALERDSLPHTGKVFER